MLYNINECKQLKTFDCAWLSFSWYFMIEPILRHTAHGYRKVFDLLFGQAPPPPPPASLLTFVMVLKLRKEGGGGR